MDGEPSAVHIVGLLAQQIEQLGVDHGNEEIERAVRVAHNQEQRCPLIPQSIQLQFVIGGNIPQLLNIKGSQSGTAGNQNRLGSLAWCW